MTGYEIEVTTLDHLQRVGKVVQFEIKRQRHFASWKLKSYKMNEDGSLTAYNWDGETAFTLDGNQIEVCNAGLVRLAIPEETAEILQDQMISELEEDAY